MESCDVYFFCVDFWVILVTYFVLLQTNRELIFEPFLLAGLTGFSFHFCVYYGDPVNWRAWVFFTGEKTGVRGELAQLILRIRTLPWYTWPLCCRVYDWPWESFLAFLCMGLCIADLVLKEQLFMN